MGVPKPKGSESEDDFVSRCMGDSHMKTTYTDQDQRLAVCFSTFRESNKAIIIEKINKVLVDLGSYVLKEESAQKQEEKNAIGLLQSIQDQMQEIVEIKREQYEEMEVDKGHKKK